MEAYKKFAEDFPEYDIDVLQEFSNILDTKIGIQDDKVTFYVFERMINQILSSCTESNNA